MRRTSTYLPVLILALGLVASPVQGQETMLSGRVYEGQTGVEPPPLGNAKALVGVTVNLYGTDNAGLMGTYITHATTNNQGWYGLSFMVRFHKYDYYNIVPTTPAGYVSEGATSVDGSVRATDWIQYGLNDLGGTTTGNKFWYQPLAVTGNQAPEVFAGDDLVEALPIPLPYPVPLAGTVTDDDLPEGQELVIMWDVVSGPGEVVFENASDPQTMAYFYAHGTYVLRLWASDGEFEASDQVTIEIRESARDRGAILFEWWFDIGDGVSVDDLRGYPQYPNWPDQSEFRTSFEGPTNWKEQYGTRVRGYIYPPATGDYTFWINSDDASELWLGMDEDPGSAVKIAEVEVWGEAYSWERYPEQRSEPQRLAADVPYYMEAVHKEGAGGDHLAVAWSGPGIGDGPVIIDGVFLSPWIRLEPVSPEQVVGVDIGGALPPGAVAMCPPPKCPPGCGQITAGGADIWGTADQFHFAYVADSALYPPETGDFTAVVRVHSLEAPDGTLRHGWAKAGIMVRESLDPGSPHVMIVRTPENGIALQGRDTQGGESWHVPVGLVGWKVDEVDWVWLRLDRVGHTVTGSFAIGGETMPTAWPASVSQPVELGPGTGTVEWMDDDNQLGLATTSHEQGVPITATYCDFAVGPYLGGPALLEPGLVAHYTFEEGEDDLAHDWSGFGRDARLLGDPCLVYAIPINIPAPIALEFDGIDDYVDCGTFNPSAATGQLSVCVWAKWNGPTDQYQGIIGKRDSWAADDMMWQVECNRDTGVVKAQRQGIPDIQDPTWVLPIGRWEHVAFTFDGAVGTLYRNGAAVASGPYSFGTDPGAAVVFGACQANGGNPFNGALADVRIYDRALSPGEIAALVD